MKQKTGRKLLSVLLTLAMVVGLLPGMGVTALAAPPSESSLDNPFDSGVTVGYASLVNTTTVVHFDSKDWYLIEDNSTAANAGTVTLLSKECVGASEFNENDTDGNTYSGSTVESFVNSWYTSNISTEAQGAVNGNGMFLLTTDQANELSSDVRKCSQADWADDNAWWLCSAGLLDIDGKIAACVFGEDGLVFDDGYGVGNVYGVRPALKLNLSKVTFDSDTNTFTVGSATVPVTGVILNKNSTTLTVGGTETLVATVAPGDATDKTVKWSVGGTDAGAVELYTDEACTTEVGADATSTLTVYAKGISAGSATVTATSNADSTKSASCDVTVNEAVTEYPLWVGDTQVTSANATSDEHPTWSYDAKSNTLTLNNFSYTGKGGNYAGSISSRNTNAEIPLTINLVGENTVCNETSDYYSYGIYHYNSSNQSLIISGEGSLDVSSKNKNGYGICSPNNDIIINGGNVTATGNNAIKGTVKNAIAGTGWTDMAGTEGQTSIAVSTEGQSLSYKKVQFPAVKDPATDTKVPTANTLTYNGQAQELVTAGTAEGGTMQYALGNATEATQAYTTSIPAKTDVGTYYVWYKVVGDMNHNDTTADKVPVTIDAAPITPKVSINGWTYGEAANTPHVSDKPGNGAVTYAYKVKGAQDSTYSENVPTDAGNYTVRASIEAEGNYKAATATANFTVAKAAATIAYKESGFTLTYGEDAPSNELTYTDGKVTYESNNTGVATVDEDGLVEIKGVGTATITATATAGANYEYAKNTASYTLTVNKAPITPKVSIQGWVSGEKANQPSVSGNSGNGSVTYTYAPKGSSSFTATVPTRAGDYTVKAVIAETANYLGGEATADFTLVFKDVVWTTEDLQKLDIKDGGIFTCKGVTLTSQRGVGNYNKSGAYLKGYNFKDDSFCFTADRPIRKIEIDGKVHSLQWPGAEKTGTGVTWTGNAKSVSFGKHIDTIKEIRFTLGDPVIIPEADFITPDALTTIEAETFYGIGAKNVKISDGVTSLGSKAFAHSSVQTINIPESVKSISSDLLDGCSGVTVYGKSDTARQFALSNGFEYVDIR